MKKIVFFFCFFNFCFTSMFAQFDSRNEVSLDNRIGSTLKSDASMSLQTSLSVLQAPLNFDNTDWTMTGTIAAFTLASFSIDSKIRKNMFTTKSRTLDKITYYGEKFGRPIYGSILSGLLYSGGLIFNDNYTRETGQILAEALILNGISTIALKSVFGRGRPYANDGKFDFDLFVFEFESEDSSFPSGHTSTAFTVATVLSERFDNIYASVALYSLASLTAYQRMYSDVHWLSDTLLGAALGTFIGLKIVKLHEKGNAYGSGYNLNIFPKVTPTNYEVGISLQF